MSESSPLDANEETLLQAALKTAFEPAPIPHVPAIPSSSTARTHPEPVASPASAPASTSPIDEAVWKAEYEAHVQAWRAQSAEARAKAEQERGRWEGIRKRQSEQKLARGETESEPEPWESLSHVTLASSSTAPNTAPPSSSSPAPTDTRDLITGEAQAPPSHSESAHARTETGSPSQKWVDIPSSPTSSFPSMSFPDPSGPPSPTPAPARHQRHTDPRSSHARTHSHVPATEHDAGKRPVPHSTLPALLDSSIAPRARLSLLLSSLAINLFLPFVNGVMLGFGEIFAKNVIVGWLWKSQGSGRVATNVGLR